MKRNMIMIVLDSVTYTVLNEDRTRKTPTPFLQELMNKGVRIENMYSQAPYTEAALVSLHCGINTLDNFGHMKRNKYKNTVFDIYKNNGYEIYTNGVQPAIYPSGQFPDIKNKKYNFPYMFSQVWNYRLKYFSDIYLKEGLDENEINLLIDIMDDNFKAWFKYFEDIISKTKEIEFIYDSIDKMDIKLSKKILKQEYDLYLKDKKTYITNLLEKGTEHNLYKIKDYRPKNRIQDRDFVKMQGKKRTPIILKILFKNFALNLLNNRMSFKVIKNYICSKQFSKLFRYFLNYCNALIDKDIFSRIDANYDGLKYVPSLNAMMKDSLSWISHRKGKKPFFIYMHAEDNHFQETFFSYDSNDEKLLDDEFELVNKGIKDIKIGYKGSIAYDLSLRYVDNCIKKYYNQLEQNGYLESTDIVIVADHGFSYYYNPIREQFVTNFYKETYNIPFIIISPNVNKLQVSDKFYMSKDIVPTMLSLSDIEIPKTINGKSLFDFKGRDYSLIEYMGGGCPHYYRRPFKLGVRTKKYSIVIEVSLKGKFEDYKFITCFDLKKDPFELNNLIYEGIDVQKISKELSIIRKRYYELKKEILSDGYYTPLN